jgi:16S rRNA (guanine527-N7)-methyltransferase
VREAAEPISGPTPTDPVAAVIGRLGLRGELRAPLSCLLELLCQDPLAPTSVREPSRAADLHLADSLVALGIPEISAAQMIIDIGSGAGLPGLPLALALPGTSVVLLESNARKCDFLRRAAARCGAANAAVVPARAESWHEGFGRADVVTARAVAPLDVVAEYAAPLLRLGGVGVVWRGRRVAEEEHALARAAELLGLTVAEPQAVVPYPGARNHHLHLLRKARPTPEAFPRRVGVARKRPLGARGF